MATRDKGRAATGKGEDSQPTPKSDAEEAPKRQQTAGAEDINGSATDAPEEVGQEQEEALPPPPPGLPANYPRQGRATIRKGVYLSALIYVEGDRPPAQDFTREAKAALRGALKEALANAPSDLKMTLKRITSQNNIEDEEPDDQKAGATREVEEKFDF